MKRTQIASGILTLLLLGIAAWMAINGNNEFKTLATLIAGAILGANYTAYGRIPEWIVDHSGGTITDDDDPANIGWRTYLPILGIVTLVAICAFAIVALR